MQVQVGWFVLKIILKALFCSRSKISELFLVQDPQIVLTRKNRGQRQFFQLVCDADFSHEILWYSLLTVVTISMLAVTTVPFTPKDSTIIKILEQLKVDSVTLIKVCTF